MPNTDRNANYFMYFLTKEREKVEKNYQQMFSDLKISPETPEKIRKNFKFSDRQIFKKQLPILKGFENIVSVSKKSLTSSCKDFRHAKLFYRTIWVGWRFSDVFQFCQQF